MYVWVDCSFSMVVKMSILNWLIQMSDLYGVSGEALWRSGSEIMCKIFCMHAAIASFPASPSLERKYVYTGSAWYLLACEHDVIKIGSEFLEQKTFCVLFNQLRIQCSVCMIFDPQ